MSTDSSSSPLEDGQSDSSPVVYQHEPFSTFYSRVLNLALDLWPESAIDNLSIERLSGGGFNRIIGLTRRGAPSSPIIGSQYIIRIPRFDAARVDHEVAILKFLHRYTTIPAPEVITFDTTANNALDSPYTVQNRISGVDLLSSFLNLDHEQRCRVARELGGIFHQLLSIQSNTAGKLVLPLNLDNNDVGSGVFQASPWASPEDSRELGKPYNDEPTTPSEPTHEMLRTILSIRKANAIKRCPSGTTVPRIWDRFCRMVQELHTGGWLADRGYSVARLDFAPRNILVDLTANTRRPIISAILDWDSAVLAPKFMSCPPPLWIWAWQEDEDEDERTANDDPPNPEARQLKAQFESAAGPDYIRLGYGPAYRLAGRLVRFAVEGVRSNEDYKEAEVMLQEWADLYTSTMSSRLL